MNSLVLFLVSILSALNPFHTDDRVATASLVFQVSDDRGAPVEDAKVDVFFERLFESGTTVTSATDSNGVCRAQGTTTGVMAYQVTKEGYYQTQGKISFVKMGQEHEKKNGKWLPWDMAHAVILPRRRNPVALESPKSLLGWHYTSLRDEWIGYDVRVNDFVAPHGKGTVPDFEVLFQWDGKLYDEFNGMVMKIRFVEKDAGGYFCDKYTGAKIQGVYAADADGAYAKEFKYFTEVIRDAKGQVVKKERHKFDTNKVLVCRSRCLYKADGELESVCYFQIKNLEYACNANGVGLRCTAFYNPTPNDTNIEPK